MRRIGGARFVVAASFIIAAALLLQARGRVEIIPPRVPLSSFPMQLGGWVGTDFPLDKETLDVLGAGDFLVRGYHDQAPASSLPFADLFIAYFPTQRAGDTIHSPKNCLPGAGWTAESSDRILLDLHGHAPFASNRYIIAKSGYRKVVLYWYWAHDRGVASEYRAKFYLVKDAIQMNRSDGALVRITADMLPGETAESAQQRLEPFTSQIIPLLTTYIPR